MRAVKYMEIERKLLDESYHSIKEQISDTSERLSLLHIK
jgi:hypothetical protein